MRRVPLCSSVICFIASLSLAVAVPRAEAGACGGVRSIALSLIAPGGSIPLDGESGPLVQQVAGGAAARRPPSVESLFARLRVTGPAGSTAVTQQVIAPGLHRLRGRFTAGAHRISGILQGGRVHFARPAAAALPAPLVTSAHHHSGAGGDTGGLQGLGGGGSNRWRPTPSVRLTLSSPPPPEAWAGLLYVGPEGRGAAVSMVEVAPTTAAAVFTQARPGRCAAPLPFAGVPGPGAPVRLAWLTRSGRISPSSATVDLIAVD